jgi:enoyl-CoA hydratase/carnithine racemase
MLLIEDPCPGVRVIGLNRAAKRNAIGVEMTLALRDAMLELQVRKDVRALVLHGIGGHFCAGMDLKDFFDNSTRDAETLRKARSATEQWRCHLVRSLPQRIFSAIEGYCLGGALPLIQCSDVVLAHTQAKFGMPEINFGFVPGGQIVKSVGLAVHAKALSYLALSGKLIDAHQAQQWGLVSRVVDDAPLPQALALAQRWANA